jgi:hypothetical protein
VHWLCGAQCNELLDIVRLPFVLATTPAMTKRWQNRNKN